MISAGHVDEDHSFDISPTTSARPPYAVRLILVAVTSSVIF
ncbi:MAG: hypothetical protein V3S93_02555 [Methyloceanibacter sp.]